MPHHALIVEVKMGELTIARLQVELDSSLCLGRTATNLGDLVFEAVRQVDARPGLRPGYRILDRLALALNQISNGVSSPATFHVHVEVNLGKDRIIDLLFKASSSLIRKPVPTSSSTSVRSRNGSAGSNF
jgi:hypothetical protein